MERLTGYRGLSFQARPDALARRYAASLGPGPVRRRMNDGDCRPEPARSRLAPGDRGRP